MLRLIRLSELKWGYVVALDKVSLGFISTKRGLELVELEEEEKRLEKVRLEKLRSNWFKVKK